MVDYSCFLSPWSISSEGRDTQKYINNDNCVTHILSPYVFTKWCHVMGCKEESGEVWVFRTRDFIYAREAFVPYYR